MRKEVGKIKNVNYRRFLEEGIIEFITEDHIKQAIGNMKSNKREAASLLIALYYTGARPNEVLELKGKDVTRDGGYVLIKLVGSKGGLPRTVYLNYTLPLVRQLYSYAKSVFGEMLLFYHFRNDYTKKYTNKKGEAKQSKEISSKLRYHIQNWFRDVIPGSITPYYLRHNRFSQLSEKGSTAEELRQIKGSRTLDSVMAYLHMSSSTAKKLARRNR